MSLFSVIRYPISNKPTAEELSEIPENIFRKWKSQTGWGNLKVTFVAISDYYSHSVTEDEVFEDSQEIEILRKMIREYDEPV